MSSQAADYFQVLTPEDECAADGHGRKFMLTLPRMPTMAVFGDHNRWVQPRTEWRHRWICMACCLIHGAATIREVAA